MDIRCSDMKASSSRKMLTIFLGFLKCICIVLFLLLLGEVLCRFVFSDFQSMRYGEFREGYRIDPLRTAGVFLLDEYTFWRLAPSQEYGMNKEGFRDSQPTRVSKASDLYRIICIGDSVTFGVPVELVETADTFSKRLETLLQARFRSIQIEVLNAGTPGYTSYQGLRQLKHRLIDFRPDLVIVQFGINDGDDAVSYPDKLQSMPGGLTVQIRNTLGKSALCNALARLTSRTPANQPKGHKAIQRVSPEDFQPNLAQMRMMGKEYGFNLVFISPVLFEEGRLIRAENHQPPSDAIIADMFHTFRLHPGNLSELFHDDCHLTPTGHQFLANLLYETILARNLIRDRVGKHHQSTNDHKSPSIEKTGNKQVTGSNE